MAGVLDFYDFWYINPEKVDGFFAQLQGYVESEWKEQTEKGSAATGRAGFHLGSILAAIGLGKASIEGEVKTDYSKLLEVTRSLSRENKIHVLLEYHRKNASLAEINLHKSTRREVLSSAKHVPFALVTGYFDCADDHMTSDPEQSAVPARIPLLEDHFLRNQAINAMSEGDYWGQNVFGTTLFRPGYLLINPIAIWFAHYDEDGVEQAWGIPHEFATD